MTFNTFGYNAVFEVRKAIVDKLLARIHDRNWVEIGGRVSEDDFVTIEVGEEGDRYVVVYLQVGVLRARFDPAATSENTLDLRVPVDAVVFHRPLADGTDPANWSRHSLTYDVEIAGLELAKRQAPGGAVLRPDLDAVSVDQIGFYPPGSKTELPDSDVDSLLSFGGVPLSAVDLKERILEELRVGALGEFDIEIPSAGFGLDWLEEWDFRLVSEHDTRVNATHDSMALMFYESPTPEGGRGIPTDVGNSIPSGGTPEYSFAISLRRDVFVETFFETYLDTEGGYFTKALTVSSTGQQRTYSLPAPPGGSSQKATVSPPQNGTVTVAIPAGGLSGHSRGELRNVASNESTSFTANRDGSEKITIPAGPGDTLELTVEAVSTPTDPDAVIWRPDLTLEDGSLRFDFRYHYHVPNWCDADGNGSVEIGLEADRSTVFDVTPRVEDYHVDLPWWAHVLGFLADVLTGGVANWLVSTILIETLGSKVVDDMVGSTLNAQLQQQLKFPMIGSERLALFLEQVEVYRKGLVFSGYADAGMITSYGRQEFDVDADVLPDRHVYLDGGAENFHLYFDTAAPTGPLAMSPSGEFRGTTDPNGRETFWAGTVDDGIAGSFPSTAVELQSGTPSVFWVHSNHRLAKLLVEWDDGQGRIRVTWVAFREPVSPRVEIEKHVTSRTEHVGDVVIGVNMCFSYGGYLDLSTRKFHRTPITRSAGLERWFWNGTELQPGDVLNWPGLSVRWDSKSDRIVLDIDQRSFTGSSLPTPPASGGSSNVVDLDDLQVAGQIDRPQAAGGPPSLYTPEFHTVTYEGEDVFGRKRTAETTLNAPACVFERKPLDYERDPFDDPLWDPPWRWQFDPGRVSPIRGSGLGEDGRETRPAVARSLAEFLGDEISRHPRVGALGESLATALTEGRAEIDDTDARIVLWGLRNRTE
jgi:hypothetical protein